jgi:hypothetical protein
VAPTPGPRTAYPMPAEAKPMEPKLEPVPVATKPLVKMEPKPMEALVARPRPDSRVCKGRFLYILKKEFFQKNGY